MFIRIVTIKCPNERAKKAFKLLNKEVKQIIDKYLLEAVDTLVVIDDNCGWNDSTNVRDIEYLSRIQFEDPSPFEININTKPKNAWDFLFI